MTNSQKKYLTISTDDFVFRIRLDFTVSLLTNVNFYYCQYADIQGSQNVKKLKRTQNLSKRTKNNPAERLM